jgi:putative drug exporter of the RND superfamily
VQPLPLPLVTSVILFGLSMDYEVFLVSRMKEEWGRRRDNVHAVATGLGRTARVVTAAAIMTVVFASFLVGSMLEVKQLGFALAVAIAIDATLARLVLVPALMRLMGRWNWWLPRPLACALPRLELP